MQKQVSRTSNALWQGISARAALIFTDDFQTIFCHLDASGQVVRKALSIEAISHAFANAPMTSGWLPPQTWRWGRGLTGEWMVLLFPAAVQHLYLVNSFPEKFTEGKIVELQVSMPPLVFGGIGSRYYIWAMGEGALSPEASAFHAPFPNVDAEGKVCFGRNELPAAASSTIAEAWRLFLATPFNDHIVKGKSQSQPDDVRQQLLAVSQRRARRYPLEDLCPTGRTIQWLIDKTFCAQGNYREDWA